MKTISCSPPLPPSGSASRRHSPLICKATAATCIPDFWGTEAAQQAPAAKAPASRRCDCRHYVTQIEPGHLAFPAQSQWGWHERLIVRAQRIEGAGQRPALFAPSHAAFVEH